MACTFSEVYNACGCIRGYNLPLLQDDDSNVVVYPVTVENVDGDTLADADSPSEYAAIWNADPADQAIGSLYVGPGAFCFYLVPAPHAVIPDHVLGAMKIIPLLDEDGTPMRDENGNVMYPES